MEGSSDDIHDDLAFVHAPPTLALLICLTAVDLMACVLLYRSGGASVFIDSQVSSVIKDLFLRAYLLCQPSRTLKMAASLSQRDRELP